MTANTRGRQIGSGWDVSGPVPVLTCGGCDGGHLVGFLAGPGPAADGHVLAVGAVGATPNPVWTVQQGRLRAFTVDVVQEDQTDALAKRPIQNHFRLPPEDGGRQQASSNWDVRGLAGPSESQPVAQLFADHLRMLLGPVVVTHRPPVAVVENLDSALPGTVSSDQAHNPICTRCERTLEPAFLTACRCAGDP